MEKHQSKIVILASLLISVAVVIYVFRSQSSTPVSVPTPSPIPVVEAAQPVTVSSPDGNMTITAMKLTNDKESTSYTFLVTDKVKGTQKGIFTKTEEKGTTLSIPDNTFSSDNRYIFLKETNGVQTNYLLLSAALSSSLLSTPIDVSGLFAAKYKNYVITDVTGWAGPTLLIVNTDKAGGGIGPTFWFDVASSSFLQLSTRFN